MTKSAYDRINDLGPPNPAIEALAQVAPERVCYCATCKETIDAALKFASQLYENQCPHYISAVAQVLMAYSKAAIQVDCLLQQPDLGMSDKDRTDGATKMHSESYVPFQIFMQTQVKLVVDTAEADWWKKEQG